MKKNFPLHISVDKNGGYFWVLENCPHIYKDKKWAKSAIFINKKVPSNYLWTKSIEIRGYFIENLIIIYFI